MLQISLFELVVRGILEGFLFILAVHAFSRTRIDRIPYTISSLIFISFTYVIRLLDINFGVHTVLNLIVIIGLCVFINRLSLFSVVKGAMLSVLIMFAIEGVNIALLQFVYKDDLVLIIADPYKKTLAGMPGIILFGITVIILYYIMAYKKNMTKVENTDGEVSE
ncbi:MAG: hypothetical protein ACYCYM_00315 [Saccharofermentanales bacterium]